MWLKCLHSTTHTPVYNTYIHSTKATIINIININCHRPKRARSDIYPPDMKRQNFFDTLSATHNCTPRAIIFLFSILYLFIYFLRRPAEMKNSIRRKRKKQINTVGLYFYFIWRRLKEVSGRGEWSATISFEFLQI